MSISVVLDSKLFNKYTDGDAFTKSFAKFLFVISFFFFLFSFNVRAFFYKS